MAMLQGLRDQRQSVDTGTGEKRIAGQRAAHISRGNFIDWYDDLGISATATKAKEVRGQEKVFSEGVASDKQKIAEAEAGYSKFQSELQGASSELSSIESQFNTLRDEYRATRNYTPGKTGQQAMDEHYAEYTSRGLTPPTLPLEFYGDEGGYYKYTSGPAKGDTAEARRQRDLAGAQALIEAKNAIAAGKSKVQGATTGLDEQRGLLQGNRDVLQGYEDQHKDQWDKIHSNYTKRQEIMKKILGGLNFG